MRRPKVSYHTKRGIGYVYALRCGELVKIGITTDLARRVREVNMHNPFPVRAEMCRAIEREYIRVIERAIHGRLDASRVTGEWFRATKQEVRSAMAWALREAHKLAGRDVRVLGVCFQAGSRGTRVYLNENGEEAFGIVNQ